MLFHHPLSRTRRSCAWLAAVLTAAAALAALPACTLFGQGSVRYYISPSGNDSAVGTSPGTAWRTLGRANSADLRPGDWLLLQGGSRFTGQLRFGPADAGDPAMPLRVGSYGSGRATIEPPGKSAVVVTDTAGIEIRNLVLIGRSPARQASAGVQLYSDRPAGHRLVHVVMAGLDVSGFGTGISIGAANPGAGFADVWIDNCAVHGNLEAGLSAFGPAFNAADPSYAHANFYLSRVYAFRNRGDPANLTGNTGSGIVLGSVRDGRISWSTAYENGGDNGAPHEGPIGIWAYDSAGILIEHNLSFANETASRRDGGGFGLDQNTSASILQYNLSYDNAGAGFQVYSPRNAANQGNTVRFNISSGDALATINAAGIIASGNVLGAQIYQNTVVMPPGTAQAHAALWLGLITGSAVRNNIFLAAAGSPAVFTEHRLPLSAVVMQGNDYAAAAGAPLTIRWGSAGSFSSLAAWRQATGQEVVHGGPAGVAADPRLVGPVLGLANSSPADPRNGAGFVPAAGSPVRGAGLDLRRLFGIDPGRADYSGLPLPPAAPNIGAQ